MMPCMAAAGLRGCNACEHDQQRCAQQQAASGATRGGSNAGMGHVGVHVEWNGQSFAMWRVYRAARCP